MRTLENFSPLDPIQEILLAAPGTEAVMGLLLPPHISLFETNAPGNASVVKARQDHERMQQAFSKEKIVVYNMRRIIGEELAKKANHRLKTKELLLQELLKRAEQLQRVYGLGNLNQAQQELEALLQNDIQNMDYDAAIAINAVLNNVIDTQGAYKPFEYNLPPAANFMFWRDTNHVTPKGAATHRMFASIRDQEVVLARIGFEALGVQYTPMNLSKNESIEGGDILPFELNGRLYSVIGQAERTSWGAVEQWYQLHKAQFSQSGEGIIPAVQIGPSSNTQDQMHNDTYVSQVAPGAIVHCRAITEQRDFAILTERNGEIVKLDPSTYAEWIENSATHVHNMSVESQLNYAPNMVINGNVDGETTAFITRDGNDEVTAFIKQHALKVVELKMNEITKFYGGAHCLTSEARDRSLRTPPTH